MTSARLVAILLTGALPSVLVAQSTALETWARARSVPADSTGLARALGRLPAEVRLIGVGESVHNIEQFLALRTAIMKELVRNQRVTAVALESGLPEAMPLDAYVSGRTASVDYRSALTYGLGEYLEVRRAFEWLREWNAGPGRARPVRVYGVDLPAGAGSMVPGLDRLMTLAGDDRAILAAVAAARPIAVRISAPFWRPAEARYDSLSAAAKDSLRVAVSRLVEATGRYKSRNVEKQAWVQRHGVVIEQALTALRVGARDPSNPRDRAMDQNTRWVLDRVRPGERVLLWQHNAHVQKIPIEGPALPNGFRATPMGMTLAEALGRGYFAIGTAYGGPSADSATAPLAGSLDATLGSLGLSPPFFLPLAEAAGPVARWLAEPRPMRFQVSHLSVVPVRAFDALVYFDRAEPARRAP